MAEKDARIDQIKQIFGVSSIVASGMLMDEKAGRIKIDLDSKTVVEVNRKRKK